MYFTTTCVLVVISIAAVVPVQFVIDAAALRYNSDAGGGAATTLAVAPGAASPALGRGCFGSVVSMLWNGTPVAVKELNASTRGATSLGEILYIFQILQMLVATLRA